MWSGNMLQYSNGMGIFIHGLRDQKQAGRENVVLVQRATFLMNGFGVVG